MTGWRRWSWTMAAGGRRFNPAKAAMRPPGFDLERALHVLKYYRAERDGKPPGRKGRKRRNATREETNAALLKALRAAEKRLALQAGER